MELNTSIWLLSWLPVVKGIACLISSEWVCSIVIHRVGTAAVCILVSAMSPSHLSVVVS